LALAEFSQTRQEELIQKPELNRVERYMLECYLNAKEGERIQTPTTSPWSNSTSMQESARNRFTVSVPWPMKSAEVDGSTRREAQVVWNTDN
jgi:hypothetical protein